MDTFAHGFWSFAIFHRKKYVWLAVLFGVLPDLLSFGILMLINLVNGNFKRGPPSLNSLPQWLNGAYNMTHSFVIFALVFLLVYLLTKKWFWPLMGWPMHVLIDIPTHSTRYFATPFLWPISNYKFDGISWGAGWFMLLNYTALAAVFIIISINSKKSRNKTRDY
ncbi:MAG TPA: hypothetical protein VI564_08210 [Candidatus Nanoarchaeia archaeon]|nr:hypothetical protein [Candidatus Nanoarchaeia archaeon]